MLFGWNLIAALAAITLAGAKDEVAVHVRYDPASSTLYWVASPVAASPPEKQAYNVAHQGHHPVIGIGKAYVPVHAFYDATSSSIGLEARPPAEVPRAQALEVPSPAVPWRTLTTTGAKAVLTTAAGTVTLGSVARGWSQISGAVARRLNKLPVHAPKALPRTTAVSPTPVGRTLQTRTGSSSIWQLPSLVAFALAALAGAPRRKARRNRGRDGPGAAAAVIPLSVTPKQCLQATRREEQVIGSESQAPEGPTLLTANGPAATPGARCGSRFDDLQSTEVCRTQAAAAQAAPVVPSSELADGGEERVAATAKDPEPPAASMELKSRPDDLEDGEAKCSQVGAKDSGSSTASSPSERSASKQALLRQVSGLSTSSSTTPSLGDVDEDLCTAWYEERATLVFPPVGFVRSMAQHIESQAAKAAVEKTERSTGPQAPRVVLIPAAACQFIGDADEDTVDQNAREQFYIGENPEASSSSTK